MGRCQEDRANIDADAANARVSRSAREHLALAAAEIELAHPGTQLADRPQLHQLLLGKWVQNTVVLIGKLVKA